MALNKKIFQICGILTFQNSNLFLSRPYGTAHLSTIIRKIYGHKAPANLRELFVRGHKAPRNSGSYLSVDTRLTGTPRAVCPGTQGSPELRDLFVRGHKALRNSESYLSVDTRLSELRELFVRGPGSRV